MTGGTTSDPIANRSDGASYSGREQCPLVSAIDVALKGNSTRIAALAANAPEQTSITYAQLDAHADRIAKQLHVLRIEPHEPVLVYISNRPADLGAILGVWRAGGVAVPVNRTSVRGTVAAIQRKAKARLAVIGDKQPATLADGMSAWTKCPEIASSSAASPDARAILRGAAFVLFTSGSTGEPKGVVLSREKFIRKLHAINEVLTWPCGLRTLLVLQLNFAFGQWVSFLTLLRGGRLAMLDRFEPLNCLTYLAEHDIDQIAVVPTMLRSMLARERTPEGAEAFTNLRSEGRPWLICTGGEPLPAVLGQKFRALLPDTGIADVFGLTETCTSDFILPPASFDKNPGSIGYPSPGVRYRIVDPENGRALPDGQTGTLEIASEFMMQGYLDAPELTAAQYHGGYFRTGDLAWRNEAGAVCLAGRSKDLIVRGGNKVSPIEVDAAMIRHPDVDASLTVGIEDDLVGERIHTVIVLRPGSNQAPQALRNWAGMHLDKFKIPDQIYFADTLPQGRTGKDDRAALERWLLSECLASNSKNEGI